MATWRRALLRQSIMLLLLGITLLPSTRSFALSSSLRRSRHLVSMSAAPKTIVITGANSGVGFAGARKLSQKGHEVYVVCRNQERSEQAAKETGE